MAAGGTRSVFISYRWEDAGALAGWVRDRILTDLPGCKVFMDVASIRPGDPFKDMIIEALSQTDVLVSLIGSRWGAQPGGRIHDPEDLVRTEVATALARGIRVVPVLIGSAQMPSSQDLPAELARLSGIKAVEFRHSRFEADYPDLIEAIAGRRIEAPGPYQASALRKLVAVVVGAAAGVVLTLPLLIIHHEATGMSVSETVGTGPAMLLIPAVALIAGSIGFLRVARKR